MPDDRVARMPLRNRAGEVVAYAVVDAEDAEQVGRYCWHLDPNGDAARSGLAGAGSGGSVPMHREILGLLPAPADG